MEVKINNRAEITLKKTMRSYIMFEGITGGAFKMSTMTDTITYFYCVIVSSDKGIELGYEEYMDWLDENPDVLTEFVKWLSEVNEIEAGQTIKKKVTARKQKK